MFECHCMGAVKHELVIQHTVVFKKKNIDNQSNNRPNPGPLLDKYGNLYTSAFSTFKT